MGYGYANGKLTTMTTTINGVTTTVASNIQYQPYGPANGWTYGNGLTRSLNYDLDGRLTALATANGSSNLQSLSYTLDANNSITGISNGVNTTQSQTYWYDELTRLINVGSAGGNWAWALDANGNRTSQSGPAGGMAYYPATDSNRLGSTAGVGARSFGTDANGNRISDTGANGTLSYTYDPFNRMQSATKNGVTTNYLVNAIGQRVRKDQGTAATTTGYVYGDGNAMLAEYSGSGSGWKSYLWLGGQLVGVVRNTTLYYVHGDHLGRPEIVTDASKNIVWRANNQAFDRTVTLDTIGGLNLGFPGQYYDAETGLWNNGFRDYDASVGRYVESDPIGLMGGINTFAYVGGNPVAYFDPLGLTKAGEYGGAIIGGLIGKTYGSEIGAWVGAIGGEFIDPAGGGVPGSYVGAIAGKQYGDIVLAPIGAYIGDIITDLFADPFSTPVTAPPGTPTLGTITVTVTPADIAAAQAEAQHLAGMLGAEMDADLMLIDHFGPPERPIMPPPPKRKQ